MLFDSTIENTVEDALMMRNGNLFVVRDNTDKLNVRLLPFFIPHFVCSVR